MICTCKTCTINVKFLNVSNTNNKIMCQKDWESLYAILKDNATARDCAWAFNFGRLNVNES